jgi:RNA polymerase sigma-70 factor (sigma-E family)
MGDDSDFTSLVAGRQAALLRFGWLLTADVEQAKDVVQEALIEAYRRWSKITPEGREAYIRKTMTHKVISRARRKGERLAFFPATPEPSPGPDGCESVTDRLTLEQALARLTERQRLYLVLRFYEDQSVETVAKSMGVSVGTVKSQTRHALRRLRTLAPELAESFGELQRVPDGLGDEERWQI